MSDRILSSTRDPAQVNRDGWTQLALSLSTPDAYRGFTFKLWPGVLCVWCSIYRDGRRVADRTGDTRAEAMATAKTAIDAGEVRNG